MAENNSSTASAPPKLAVKLFPGQRLPFFMKDSSDPNPFSSMDMNMLVAVCNLLLNLQINFKDPVAQSDGTLQSSATINISDQNMVIDLAIAGGGGGDSGGTDVVPMQVASYSTANEYLSAYMGSFTAADTFTPTGAPVNVALPWEFRGEGDSIYPAYDVGDIIYAINTDAGTNGVYVGGSELSLMDLGLGRSLGSGMLYLGDYDSTQTYTSGNVVRLSDGSVNAGVWICVKTATASNPPTYPEPATTGGTNYWELFAFGVQAENVCYGGSTKTTYINATPPS